jgi:nonribosomal peptide synthetase DhbF
VYEQSQLTYRELNTRANQIAYRLRALGVKRNEIVGIYLERDTALVCSVLAVLKSGAAYTLLDPQFPHERLKAAVEDARASIVITESWQQSQRWSDQAQVLCLQEHRDDGSASHARNPGVKGSPEDFACVMFTSGSTGRPKGVVSSHRALVGTYLAQDYTEFDARQVFLQCSPVSWDAFGLELFGSLLFGGVCVLQPGQKPEPEGIVALVRRHGVTMLQVSASLFNLLVEEYGEIFERVRHVITGGEAASVRHVDRALREFPGLRVSNGYGPAESMGFTTCHRI